MKSRKGFEEILAEKGFAIKNEGTNCTGRECWGATIKDENGNELGIYFAYVGANITARIDKINGTHKWYYEKTQAQMLAVVRQCMEGHDFSTFANAQKDINDAIESGLIEADTTTDNNEEENTMMVNVDIARNLIENAHYVDNDTNENEKEETTMTNTTFTTNSGMTYSISGTRYFKAGLDGKKTRISKAEYELAQDLYEKEQAAWEAEADAERKAREDKMAADAKATEDAVNGKTRKTEEEIAKLDDAAEDPNVSLHEFCEMLSKDEKTAIEPAEAELLNNARKEKKAKGEAKKTARKPRKSKDIAYEGHGITLTAKQVDFIHHLPDTCFWENGLDSTPWTDILADEIGGQFEGKPMTTGAMISTICEKGLATRGKGKVNGKKATYLMLTDLGKEVAKELGLE